MTSRDGLWPTPSSMCESAVWTSRSSRPRRSGISGSRTDTASSATCVRGPGSCSSCRRSSGTSGGPCRARRRSAGKGGLELVEACRDLPLVVVGDGPLRSRVPGAVGFVPPGELGPWYERAAVIVVPSRREGYGVVAREAMAWGRPVVASAVGGLLYAVEDEVTGLRVAPGDVPALRAALARLLAEPALRARLGAAAREKAQREFSFDAAADAMVAAYRDALA